METRDGIGGNLIVAQLKSRAGNATLRRACSDYRRVADLALHRLQHFLRLAIVAVRHKHREQIASETRSGEFRYSPSGFGIMPAQRLKQKRIRLQLIARKRKHRDPV